MRMFYCPPEIFKLILSYLIPDVYTKMRRCGRKYEGSIEKYLLYNYGENTEKPRYM